MPDLRDQIARAPVGQVSDPIVSAAGVHIFLVRDQRARRPRPAADREAVRLTARAAAARASGQPLPARPAPGCLRRRPDLSRRPAGAPDRAARPARRQAAGPALPVRPVDPASHRGRRRRPRGGDRARGRSGPGRADPRAARRRARHGWSRSSATHASSPHLRGLEAEAGGRLEILVEPTRWRWTLGARGERTGLRIVANLPYNVATPLLFGWFDRLACIGADGADVPEGGGAAADRRARLGRLRPARGDGPARCAGSSGCSTCPPAAFTPPPKVSSSVVRLTPAPGPAARRAARHPGRPHPRRLRPAPQDAARQPAQASAAIPWPSWRPPGSSRPGGRRSWTSGSSSGWPRSTATASGGPRAGPARSSGAARRRWWRRARRSSR